MSSADAGASLDLHGQAHRLLATAAADCKAVVVAGLPGVGKTLMLKQLVRLCHAAGRRVHLLQWDVARLAFETPPVLARFPEADGVTHAVLRLAAGVWVREAVALWAGAHRDDTDVLLTEAPLVGNRFVELAWVRPDAAEPFLAAAHVRFIIPVPTPALRRVIEAERARNAGQPRHARELADARPDVVEALMQELRRAAPALGVHVPPGSGYDPELYASVYRRVLERRHAVILPLDECLPNSSSAYDLAAPVQELRPTATQTQAALAVAAACGADRLERTDREWYLPVP